MNVLLAEPLELTNTHRETVRAVGPGIWRVTDSRGLTLGNIRSESSSQGVRFHAMRFHLASATFRSVGEFWSADEALACLRYSR